MIQVFKSLPVARASCHVAALPPAARAYRRDTMTLGWEERMKARARRASDRGFEFATVLERGQVLREGDCFVFDSPALVVVVVELAEPVLIVRPETPPEWALYGYHIGNGHQPLMVTEREIVCADDAGAEQLLRYHAIPFTRGTRPFTPVGQSPAHRHPVMR